MNFLVSIEGFFLCIVWILNSVEKIWDMQLSLCFLCLKMPLTTSRFAKNRTGNAGDISTSAPELFLHFLIWGIFNNLW